MAHTAIGHFMNQKDFHPANFHNQKRVWIAKQKQKAQENLEKERLQEYQREQTEHDTKGYALMSKQESHIARQRHDVNFMYEAPAGMDLKKPENGEGIKLQLDESRQLRMDEKFAVLKGAPREAYAKDIAARDNPFGVQVKNVQCFRCKAWGHQHTDRVCPLFTVHKAAEGEEAERQDFEDPAVLMKRMNEEGFALKQNVLGRKNDITAANQQMLLDEAPADDPDVAFLASLSKAEKKKLFKKLSKLEQAEAGLVDGGSHTKEHKSKKAKKEKRSKHSKKKGEKDKRKKSKKASKQSDSDDDSSNSEHEDPPGNTRVDRENPDLHHQRPRESRSPSPQRPRGQSPSPHRPRERRSRSPQRPRGQSPSPQSARGGGHRGDEGRDRRRERGEDDRRRYERHRRRSRSASPSRRQRSRSPYHRRR
eukprot:m.146331 g.146331  ORF g.146331 m.146331 type:complete len:422 (-) comp17767_c0_seq9:46-1311(-)